MFEFAGRIERINIDHDAAGEQAEYDPSDTGIHGAYVAALHDHIEIPGSLAEASAPE